MNTEIMRRYIRNGLEIYFNRRKANHRKSYFKSSLKNLNKLEKVEREKEYIEKWSGFGLKVDPEYLRIYTHITGKNDINFVPEDLYQLFITNILNQPQERFGYAFGDKNLYEKLHEAELFPTAILRNIDGIYYDKSYDRLTLTDENFEKKINKYDCLIVKPSIDSGAGKMVKKFDRKNDGLYNGNREKLSLNYLSKVYNGNFIVQECLKQHPFLSQFNRSSLNTIRVMTYRSVKDEKIKILGAMLKIGGENSVVDHMAKGGCAIGINHDGSLANWSINKAGVKLNSVNSINLGKKLTYPKYEEIVSTAKRIAEGNHYHRLLGLDMAVDHESKVRVVEINNGYVGLKGYQLTGRSFFQKYTDEVIEYCKSNLDVFNKQFVLKI